MAEKCKVGDCVSVEGRSAVGEVREIGKGRNDGKVRLAFPDATTAWVDAGTLTKIDPNDDPSERPSRHDDDDLPKGKEARAIAIEGRRAEAERLAMPNQIRNVGVLGKSPDPLP